MQGAHFIDLQRVQAFLNSLDLCSIGIDVNKPDLNNAF
jgi:hypothetical protein